MGMSDDGVIGSTLTSQVKGGGSIPASSLHFSEGQRIYAEDLVRTYHYSHRIPSNIQFIGSFHLDGGLFGNKGDCVATAIFSIPPTRWAEPVLELSRLVRRDDIRIPLSKLISMCLSRLKNRGVDLNVSFADKTHGHEGYVYRASNWKYGGLREKRMDGLIVDGRFIPGRSANSMWGTRSPRKLKAIFPKKDIKPHFDMGKHCYFMPLSKDGVRKAARLGLMEVT